MNAGRDASSTVIVIDDHPLCAAAVSAALARRNPQYETLSCGSLKELGAILPDPASVVLVLLDLMLPDATGMSGVRAVRALLPDVPICVISSRTDTATIRQAIAQDIVGFLPKTLAFDQMTDALGRVLNGEAVFPRLAKTLTEDSGPLSPAATPDNDPVLAKMLKSYPIARGTGRLSRPEDISGLVAFLVSNRAQYITGQTIGASGGFVIT